MHPSILYPVSKTNIALMKKVTVAFISIILLSFTAVQQQTVFQQLYALTGGTWVMKTKKGYFAERREKKNATTLQNRAFKISGTDTTILEQVELIQTADHIHYISTVKDQNGSQPVLFRLIEAKDDRFIFVNPDHDFPQRIIYHFVAKDSLHAWIEGNYNGKETRSDFYYKRVF